MRFASTNATKLLVAYLVVNGLTPCLGNAQVALPGELDPSGRVYTQIVARVGELGSNTPPITGLTVYVVSVDGHRITLRTNRGGTAATWLARARYRIVTPEPFQLEGRMYTWDTITVVRPGMTVIRLQLSNAKFREVPVVRWRTGDAASGETRRDGRAVRSAAREGVAISATMIRRDDILWAYVTISNGSKRSIDVDPQTFTLNQLSPKQTALRYLAPPDDVLNQALVASTLLPGQAIVGAVFFEPDKDSRELLLRIPLSGVTFEVPFSIR